MTNQFNGSAGSYSRHQLYLKRKAAKTPAQLAEEQAAAEHNRAVVMAAKKGETK